MSNFIEKIVRPAYFLSVLLMLPSFSAAATIDDEISFLLSSLATEDCTFIRNDISYSSKEFEQHLRSKLSANEELISSAEDYIEKIATRSAVSGKPYVAVCSGELKITKEWFAELLEAYRNGN
jgi:hypothetical protein